MAKAELSTRLIEDVNLNRLTAELISNSWNIFEYHLCKVAHNNSTYTSMAGVKLNFGPQRRTVQGVTGGDEEYKTKPNESIYFVNCSDCSLTVNSRCLKVSSSLAQPCFLPRCIEVDNYYLLTNHHSSFHFNPMW